MSPDPARTDAVAEPARHTPVIGRPDVLVVGAGSAGIAAAVAAARQGAATWLIEKSGFVGGLATVGLINLLLTLDDGAGHQVVGGICQEVVDRLGDRAVFPAAGDTDVERWRPWGLIWGAPETVRYSVAFDPEAFVDVSLAMLAHAGVRIRLHTLFAGVAVEDGRICAVFVESKKGREAIVPGVVIDTSGDGDVMVAAGAPFEQVPTPPHLWFRAWSPTPVGFRTLDPNRWLIPWGPHPDRVDACDPDDMTRAELACRAAARAALPAGAVLDDYARMLGITESRRLAGAYVLGKEDAGRHFPDTVARTGHWTVKDVVFDIPYRCLVAPPARNLLVAGRCISVTRYVHQATKEIPAAMATGEAAGVAAAVAVADGAHAAADVHAVDTGLVRARLVAAGALL